MVMVGGSSVIEEFARRIGSDAWEGDAGDLVGKADVPVKK